MKTKQKTKSKVLLILNTLMLIMLFIIPVYAYWGGLINGSSANDNETIEIGKGQDIITTVELSNKTLDGGKLVPEGRAVEATDVEEVVLTYEVLWTDTEEASHGAVGTLTITFDNNPENLLNIVVDDGVITAGTPKTITLTITLTEPANKTQYDLVANQDFTLTIIFSVEEVE